MAREAQFTQTLARLAQDPANLSMHNPAIIRAKRAGIEVKKLPSAQSHVDSEVMRVIKPSATKTATAPGAQADARDPQAVMPPVEKIEQMASMFRGRATSFPNNLDLPQRVTEVAR